MLGRYYCHLALAMAMDLTTRRHDHVLINIGSFQHSDLREEIRLHSLHITKELVAQVEFLNLIKLKK